MKLGPIDPNLLDERYLVETLVRLLQVPTEVPLGPNTLMEPDDPKLVHYVQEVIRPELRRIGVSTVLDVPRNQLVVRLGRGTSPETLLIQVYTPTQHANFMAEPFSGRIAVPPGGTGSAAYGQGASQNKAHMAAMLAVLKLLVENRVDLPGTLYVAVNNEGRSSHACTEAILAAVDSEAPACHSRHRDRHADHGRQPGTRRHPRAREGQGVSLVRPRLGAERD